MSVFQGSTAAGGRRFAIVVSRFNELVTKQLLEGALGAFERHGAGSVDVAWVPGAVEIPLIARKLATSGNYGAVVTLGAVIKGATSHYDYVCSMVASGVAAASEASGVPVIFGVLTTETLEQALDRAGGKSGNKGAEAALAAIEMADLVDRLPK